ncbi:MULTISPECIES: hypothetical protein [unclassified Mesorhizobium]|uniref:hypothetical protein n=1 Tax=unclassified Mesorhizobium TaxID=325217 RepID=UPI00112AD675|nr:MULTISPECIES: hypothetical protein [unclassified Mesorhizobium]MBZ9974311.1 hypothetical protein [Mesorhizobium sp. BR-1-1-10]TPK10199.1 hypothetical protein FJ543_21950 [Mesorhizobium sp. B2-5-7]
MNFRENSNGQMTVAAIIKRQIGSNGVKRYTATLPVFQVDDTIPEVFKALLEQLDQAEKTSLHKEPPRRASTRQGIETGLCLSSVVTGSKSRRAD